MDCVTAGNIMVHLFLQTQPKYHLNNQKLQYLLCIAQLAAINNGQCLFEEPIRNLKNNFSLEKIADNFICNSSILDGTTKQTKLELTYDDFLIPYTSKRLYEIKGSFTDEQKRLLIDVFVRFGAYDEKVLCDILNKLTPLRCKPVWSYISSEEISDFFVLVHNEKERYEENEIIAFCQDCFSKNENENIETDTSETREEDALNSNITDTSLINSSSVCLCPDVLKPHISLGLKKFVTGKMYSLYIEAPKHKTLNDVIIVSLKDDKRIYGDLKRINKTLYCYSFAGVPTDIKVIIDI